MDTEWCGVSRLVMRATGGLGLSLKAFRCPPIPSAMPRIHTHSIPHTHSDPAHASFRARNTVYARARNAVACVQPPHHAHACLPALHPPAEHHHDHNALMCSQSALEHEGTQALALACFPSHLSLLPNQANQPPHLRKPHDPPCPSHPPSNAPTRTPFPPIPFPKPPQDLRTRSHLASRIEWSTSSSTPPKC